jgi:hypothetical protein
MKGRERPEVYSKGSAAMKPRSGAALPHCDDEHSFLFRQIG